MSIPPAEDKADASFRRLSAWSDWATRHRSLVAVLSDFDGTLSPIVSDPSAARPYPHVPDALSGLAERFALVAVVSGRPVSFLSQALPDAEGVWLVGLYGLEQREPGGQVTVAPEAIRWRPVVKGVVQEARQDAPRGVLVETKGLSVTLHWRQAPREEPWARAFANHQAGSSGLHAQLGRMAVELRPPLAIDKGTAVRSLVVPPLRGACFLGDDLGDLPAYGALSELSASGLRTLGIAVVDDESEPEVAEVADVVVDGPKGALSFMQNLAI